MSLLILLVLIALLICAAVTDVWKHVISNWLTYPGILLGWLLNGVMSGWVGFQDSLAATFACGFVMIVCFLLFQLGGGDVKIISMIASFLGMEKGIEAMLWTFIIGAIIGIGLLIGEKGAWNIIRGICQHLWLVVRTGSWVAPTESERKPLRRSIYLAPATLLAVLLVTREEFYRLLSP